MCPMALESGIYRRPHERLKAVTLVITTLSLSVLGGSPCQFTLAGLGAWLDLARMCRLSSRPFE